MQLPMYPQEPRTPSPKVSSEEKGFRKPFLSPRERQIVAAIAEAAMPQGNVVDGGGEVTADRLERYFRESPSAHQQGVRGLLWSCEGATLATHFRPFSALSLEERSRLLSRWADRPSFAARTWLRSVLTPLKTAHFDDEETLRRLGCRYRAEQVQVDEKPRWLGQVMEGHEIQEDLDLECEVVVIGTGAGGAAVAYELASRGRAVLLLEEGRFHRRSDFSGRASEALQKYYRDRGITFALGNVGVPVWAGRMVGGSTTINSGTCYRTPERTFRYWRERHGLPQEFSSQGMNPYFERVESMLEVSRAEHRFTGGVGRVIARGAAALGYEHAPLPRNAPGCDGQGMCCYGCPTGAKRSTETSYIPAALQRGAQLITGARADRVDIVAGRARGVTATLASGRKLKVKAEAVVVAGGALMTPLLLARSGACTRSGWLGKNLSIHPAAQVLALFDEDINMSEGIPQGYGIESFAEEGLMFEGCSTPPDVLSIGIPWSGRPLMDLMDNYRRLAVFGFMIQDHSRGTVREGPGGSPLITYNMSQRDASQCQRGLALLSEVFLEAGARRVFPFALGHNEITDHRGLKALQEARLRPGDFDVAAFHPLGTCRMGTDPRKSCVGPDQQAHDVEGLYVCDGSVMPSSLGVNPQITIMAMSLKAAEQIDHALS